MAGETDPAKLAELAHRNLTASPQVLYEALRGRVTRHHRFLLGVHLKLIDSLDALIASIDQEVDTPLGSFRDAVELLRTTPGASSFFERAQFCFVRDVCASLWVCFLTSGRLCR